MLTESELEAIEKRLEAATEGPWEAVPECPDGIAANVKRVPLHDGRTRLSALWVANVDMENRDDYTDELESESAERDRHFIANAPTDIAALLADLKLYKKALEEAVEIHEIEYANEGEIGWKHRGISTEAPALATILKGVKG